MTAAATAPQTPVRDIKTRRIEFSYPTDSMPHYYMSGDPVMSHATALCSALFPQGEDFFVRSVRNYRDKITDPELKKQVAGFIGQEAIHGREHREFNKRLQQMGYQVWVVDRGLKIGLGLANIALPKAVQVAMTAALEHYTATMAEVLMTDAEAREQFGDTEAQKMLLWHALEESEHKSVAFDVFQEMSGKLWLRRAVMNAMTIGFLGLIVLGAIVGMLIDPQTWRHPRQAIRSARRVPSNPWLKPSVRERIRDYHRSDFHPDDHDTTELITEWRAALFGPEGALNDRLKRTAAGTSSRVVSPVEGG